MHRAAFIHWFATISLSTLVLCGCAAPQKNSDAFVSSARTEKTLSASALADLKLPTRNDGFVIRADSRARGDSSFNASVIDHASELSWSFATSNHPGVQSVTRLESSWSRTLDEDSEQRLRLGDTVSSPGSWGSAIRYGGVQFGTPDARTDVIASRRLATPGISALPSTADAIFSSARGSSSLLRAERWSTGGSTRLVAANTVSFIAQDALGRTQVITQPLLAKTVLADAGCSGFSVGFGKVREDYALQSNEYGPVFANTTVRCGLSRKLTVETHGEYLEGETAAWGLDLTRKIGTGFATAAVASSRAEGESGWLAKIGFEHSNSLFDLALSTRLQSRTFREAASHELADPVVQQTLATLGVRLNDTNNLAVAYAAQTTAVGERVDVLAVTQSMYMGAYGSLSMTAGHSVAQGQDSSVYLFYSRSFGRALSLGGPSLKGIVTPNFDLALRTSGMPAKSVR